MTRPHGFTLVELMVTIAVLAILASIAVPGFQSIIQNNRATTMANELTTAVNLARSEAVKRGVEVSVCPTGGTWWDGANGGWSVDVSGDCSSAQNDLLRIWSDLPPRTSVDEDIDGDNRITFGPLGERTSAGPTTADDPMFVVAAEGCQGDRARALNISPGGRISVARVACP